MPRDYYDVLGVSRSASSEEITKAYRKLARQHHPDRNPGDKQAEVTFKEIQTAYETLSDANKKAVYDQYGPTGPPGGAPGAGPGGGFGFRGNAEGSDSAAAEELFRNLFGGGNFGGATEDMFGGAAAGGGGRRRARRRPAEDVEVEAAIPFEVAVGGGSITVSVEDRELSVKVPPGVEDGKKLRLGGQGPGGGDIHVRIRIEAHPYFRREGKDVILEVPLSLAEAALGCKITVPTTDGLRVEVKIPAGTSSGAKLRLRGKGIAGGDQYLQFKVMVPAASDERSKQLIEEFAQLNPQEARANVAWK